MVDQKEQIEHKYGKVFSWMTENDERIDEYRCEECGKTTFVRIPTPDAKPTVEEALRSTGPCEGKKS